MIKEQISGLRRDKHSLLKAKINNYKMKFSNQQEGFTGTDEQLLLLFQAEEAYGFGSPIITDTEFDELAEKTNYSQSLRAPQSSSGRNWIKMNAPLVSLLKVAKIDELKKFLDGFQIGTQFYIEPKLDGLTFNAVYKRSGTNFVLSSISSRGDGRLGLEFHPDAFNGLQAIGLPKTISEKSVNIFPELENSNGEISFRGEAIVMKDDPLHQGKLLRSVAAGMLNRKIGYLSQYSEIWENHFSKKELSGKFPIELDPIVVKGERCVRLAPVDHFATKNKNGTFTVFEGNKVRQDLTDAVNRQNKLTFVTFAFAYKGANAPSRGMMEIFEQEGIIPVSQLVKEIAEGLNDQNLLENGTSGGTAQTIDLVKRTNLIHPNWRFPVDGLVIKPVHTSQETQMLNPTIKNGKIVYPHHPKDQVAYKFPPVKVVVKLAEIHESKTSLGNFTYSGELDKVYVMPSGTRVTRVNLHNKNWLDANPWIKPGAILHMHLSNDIIPVLSEIK